MSKIQNKESQANETDNGTIHIPVVSGFNEPSFTEITNAENEAYKQAGENAYFGNGFRAGVKWMYDRVKEVKSFELTDEQMEQVFWQWLSRWYKVDV